MFCFIVLTGHAYDVNCVAFSPEGKYIATGSDDAKVIKIHSRCQDTPLNAFSCFRPFGDFSLFPRLFVVLCCIMLVSTVM